MAGREVREYTNLTDPKGIFFSLNVRFHVCIYNYGRKILI